MKLYAGNLSYSLSESELHDLFSPFGEVQSVKIITDRESDRSKGFGFVEMGSREEGQQAIDSLNGTEVQNRKIIVNEARPQAKKGSGDRGSGRW